MPIEPESIAAANSNVDDVIASRLLRLGQNGFGILLALAIVALIVYALNFGTKLSAKPDDWGTFGDFFGGLFNPVLGFLTVYLVLINARFQQQELRNSVIEMRNSNLALHEQNLAIQTQNFQNAFFNWLTTYRQTVEKARYTHRLGRTDLEGATALSQIYDHTMSGLNIENRLRDNNLGQYFSAIANYLPIEASDIEIRVKTSIIELWREVRNSYGYALDPVLRSSFGLAQWIFEQPGSTITLEKKNEHFRILGSHLSDIEITLLFYEATSRDPALAEELNKLKFFTPIIWADPILYFLTSNSSVRNN